MTKIVRLTENDLTRLVKKIIKEEPREFSFDDEDSELDMLDEYGDKIFEILQDCYKKYGKAVAMNVLDSVNGVVRDIGAESFGGPMETY